MNRQQTKQYLDTLREKDELRELVGVKLDGRHLTCNGRDYLNLCSNDYLGLTDDRSPAHLGPGGRSLQWEFFHQLGNRPPFLMSNPSSRLLGGNNVEYEMLEHSLANLFPGQRKALVLNSGFAANSGVLKALADKCDLLLVDRLCHASIVDGMRLAGTGFQRFRHNDMDHLEALVVKNRDRYRSIWVVTESVFSMDGDRCPLADIVALKERYGLQVLLDEAHSFGLCGAGGAGYASHLGLADRIDVITGSLGKALASTGGFVIADTLTGELLVNRMRTIIYSTALPSINLAWTDFLIRRLRDFESRRRHLRALAEAFSGNRKPSHIVPLIVGDNLRTMKAAEKLREAGFWASVVRHPTVARGTERVRVSLCASMTLEEIAHLKAVWGEVSAGLGMENSLR